MPRSIILRVRRALFSATANDKSGAVTSTTGRCELAVESAKDLLLRLRDASPPCRRHTLRGAGLRYAARELRTVRSVALRRAKRLQQHARRARYPDATC